MRLTKMFGLVAVAVTIVTAFIGATSASAVSSLETVVVCKSDHMSSGTCPSAYSSGTKIDGPLVAGTISKFETNLGTIKCTESEFSDETSSSLAHGLITEFKIGICFLGGIIQCSITIDHLPILFLVLLTTNHTEYHAIVSEHGNNGKPKLLVACGTSLKCDFSHAEILFTVLLEAHDTVWEVNQELEREGGSGFLCPASSNWNAIFLIRCLEPAGTFVDCWPSMEAGSPVL